MKYVLDHGKLLVLIYSHGMGTKICLLACENIRFYTLFAAGHVSRGGTSATQFHTDDVKYVQNPVRSPDWSTE